MKKQNDERLRLWQSRRDRAEADYADERNRMDQRERLYRGDHSLKRQVEGDSRTTTPHVRNLCAEMIESVVDSNIPQPKVTARREEDELLAKEIEDMLRNELDRLPFEMMNDMMERTVPIQGGAAFLVEWDDTITTPRTVGELAISTVHPKQIIPQDGVTDGIDGMDWIILAVPQTKEYVRRRYGIDVEKDSEEAPEVRGEAEETAEDLVTEYMAYYRNDKGGIGLFAWVNDTVLEDLDDYQARRLRRCASCGAAEQPSATELTAPPVPEDGEAVTTEREKRRICPHCGGTEFTEREEGWEEIYIPIRRTDGSVIPGARMELRMPDEPEGMPSPELAPTRVPFYKPDIFPVILQKNVSVYGKLLGESDVDRIEDQQNTTNRMEAKIIDKLVKAGSYLILPEEASIPADAEDVKVIRPESAAAASMIDVKTTEGYIEQDMAYLAQVYEEARQIIGITDSFQGRRDATATSGKAKEFSAAQSAGRLESRRIMKHAAYASLFEAMFKFKLAYCDEPRPIVMNDVNGDAAYGAFNRYDFLEQDPAGNWYWNTDFLFSCDSSAPLASNREAMWQEARMNLQTGAFGDPAAIPTLILFWTRMEALHYPGAGETRRYLEEQQQRQMIQPPTMQGQQTAEIPAVPAAEPMQQTPQQKLVGVQPVVGSGV